MLEEYLIKHCSPTLASIKPSNLMNIPLEKKEDIIKKLDTLNKSMASKGISLLLLCVRGGKALVYVYRRGALQNYLKRKEIAEFLEKYGYTNTDIDFSLARLKERTAQNKEFPHEIGVFLGYPLEDVRGFIENKGKNCKCIGCWKVYCNEIEAQKTFEKFEKCRNSYIRLWQSGTSILQLTVTV